MTLRVRLMILGKQIGRDLIPALAEKERIFAAPEEVSRAINKKQFTPKALAMWMMEIMLWNMFRSGKKETEKIRFSAKFKNSSQKIP